MSKTDGAGLFDRLPPRLFSVLASPGQAVYAQALFAIYALFRQMPFGLPRDVVMDALADTLADRAPTADVLADLGEEAAADPRSRAQAILRRFREDGWLEIEVRSTYEEFVTLADYAGKLLETLDRIRTQRRTDYMGFVYLTYAALTVDEADRQGAMAIARAREQSEQLVAELKLLHHNIRRYTKALTQRNAASEVLAMHFRDYKLQVLDRSYHHLRTSDHVSKYRPRILARVEDWLRTPGRIEAAVREEQARLGSEPEGIAERIREDLQFIRTAYTDMDQLLDEIDQRNAQYAKASLEQVRYLLSSDEGTAGQLVEILTRMAAQLASGAWRGDAPPPAGWEAPARLFALQTLDPASLYAPRRARTHQPAALSGGVVSDAQRTRARRRAAQQLRERLTAERVQEWLLQRMADRAEVRAEDLGIADTGDFVRLVYVGALGRSRRVGFAVEYAGEAVTSGRYRFRNVTIRRREP